MTNVSPVRIGHCVPDAPDVDVRVDGEIAFEGVAFTDVTDYATLPSGSHEVAISAHGETDPVLEAALDLDEDTSYTALATGILAEDDIAATVMMDAPGKIASGMCHARFAHASPDAPAVDVRVADDGPTLFQNVSFREASEYTPVDTGTSAITAIAVGQLDDGSLSAVLTEDATATLAADD
jgi:hypothetical protein